MENNFSAKGKIRLTDVLGVNAEDYSAEGSELLMPGNYFIPGGEGFFYAGGRRKECKAKGLKGKAFRSCLKDLRARDKNSAKAKQNKKSNQNIIARVLTGGVSAIFEGKKGRKATNEKIKKDTKETAKVVANAIKRSVFGVPILSYMALLRINLFGQAAQMYPGLLTEQQAREKGYNIDNWKKAVKLVANVKKGLAKFGSDKPGDVKLFEDAVRLGHDKPPFRSKKKAKKDKEKAAAMAARAKAQNKKSADGEYSNVEGIWEAAAIAAGSAVIGIVADLVKKSGVKSNPYDAGKEPAGFIPDNGGVGDELVSPDVQKKAIKDEIINNPDYTPEQKQTLLAEVDGAVDYLNSSSAKSDAEGSEDDLILYGGIALGGIALIVLMAWMFKSKSA